MDNMAGTADTDNMENTAVVIHPRSDRNTNLTTDHNTVPVPDTGAAAVFVPEDAEDSAVVFVPGDAVDSAAEGWETIAAAADSAVDFVRSDTAAESDNSAGSVASRSADFHQLPQWMSKETCLSK